MTIRRYINSIIIISSILYISSLGSIDPGGGLKVEQIKKLVG